jgi:protein O-mannosyl-transferase
MPAISGLFKRVAPGYYVVLAAVGILTLVVYAGVLNNGFLYWDDHSYVSDNPHIQQITLANLKWMLLEHRVGNWHPLTWLSHAVDYALWSDNPGPHHILSVVLHLTNSLLVFYLAIQLQVSGKAEKFSSGYLPDRIVLSALLAATLFAIHPQHVESVAWLAERKDVLCAFFYLLTMVFYLRRGAVSPRDGRMTLPLLWFFMALMSKSMAVTLPVALLLLDVYPLQRLRMETWRSSLGPLLKEKASFFLLAVAVVVITLITQDVAPAADGDLSLRFWNALNSLFLYPTKWLVPVGLSPFYPYPDWVSAPNLFAFCLLLTFLGVTLFCVHQAYRDRPYWLVGWLYYLVTILPVIGLVKVGEQAAADRYTYLPMVVFYLAAGILLSRLTGRFADTPAKSTIIAGAVLIYGGLLGITSVRQIPLWHDDEILWSSVITRYPGMAAVAYNNLGNVYFRSGDLAQAVSLYQTGLKVSPSNYNLLLSLSLAYERQGMIAKALAQGRESARTRPDSASAQMEVGKLHQRHGAYDVAEDLYRKAARLDPASAESHYLLARLYLQTGKTGDAASELQMTVRLDPKHIDGHLLLGKLLQMSNHVERARNEYQLVLRLDPDNVAASKNLKQLKGINGGR